MNEQRPPKEDEWAIFGYVVMIGIVFATYHVVITFFSPVVKDIWIYIRVAELSFWWLYSWPAHYIYGPSPDVIMENINWLLSKRGGHISYESIERLNQGYAKYWFFFPAFFFAWLGAKMFIDNRIVRHDLYETDSNGNQNASESLLRLVAKVRPELKIYVKENPADYPVDYRPYQDNRYAQRVTPWDFMRMSIPPGLDTVEGDPYRDIGPILLVDNAAGDRFNYKAAQAVLEWQLGNRTDRGKTLSKMSETELKVYRYIYKNLYKAKHVAADVFNSHAYIRTALMELYYRSNATTSDIPWLKYEDRTLWYCLQDASLDVCSAECAGPWSHWQVERPYGKPIPIPSVDLAINWFHNLSNCPQEEFVEFLREDKAFRSRPDYWEHVRNEAVAAAEKQHKEEELAKAKAEELAKAKAKAEKRGNGGVE